MSPISGWLKGLRQCFASLQRGKKVDNHHHLAVSCGPRIITLRTDTYVVSTVTGLCESKSISNPSFVVPADRHREGMPYGALYGSPNNNNKIKSCTPYICATSNRAMLLVSLRYDQHGCVIQRTPSFRIEDSVLRDAYWSHPPTAVRAPVKRSIPVLLTA